MIKKTSVISLIIVVAILILASFVSLASAAECQQLFYTETSGRTYKAYYTDVNSVPPEQCSEQVNDGHVVMSGSEYAVLKSKTVDADNVVATLVELFEFSAEDFALFNAICLVAFIGGHSLGRVARIMGKS